MAQLVTAPALLIAGKVSNLTDAIADVVELLGNEDTRKLLVGLAEGLGAPSAEADHPEGRLEPWPTKHPTS